VGEEIQGSGNPARSKKAAKRMQILARRLSVAKLYVRGVESSESIAEKLGVCPRTVRMDLQAIKEEWRASAIRDFDHQIELEKRKLDDLEQQAREAWEKSQEPAETVTVVKDENGKLSSTTIKEEDRVGDAQYLEQARKAMADRRKLLGLEQPATKKHAHFHAHLGDSSGDPGIIEQRNQLLALAQKFGIAGQVFDGIDSEQPANGHAATGGSNGHPHSTGSNGHADGADSSAE